MNIRVPIFMDPGVPCAGPGPALFPVLGALLPKWKSLFEGANSPLPGNRESSRGWERLFRYFRSFLTWPTRASLLDQFLVPRRPATLVGKLQTLRKSGELPSRNAHTSVETQANHRRNRRPPFVQERCTRPESRRITE